MAANTKQLVKDWIQYLKSTQIVALKSDSSGKLQYNRPVTSEDVSTFLEAKTDYTPDQIGNAIHMVLAKNAQGGGTEKLPNNPSPEEPAKPGSDLSTWMHYGMRPGDPKNRLQGEPAEPQKQVAGQSNNKLNYDPNSVSDIDYRDVPNKDPEALPAPSPEEEPKRRPRFKLRTKGLKEDFEDNQGYELDENDVEQIFNMLASGAPAQDSRAAQAPQPDTPKTDPEALNKLKRTIRDTMNDQQRKALWRALSEI